MKFNDMEKNIYELLGVNIFRKYVLFTWNKLCKPIGGAPGYRIKNIAISDIEEYKSQAQVFGFTHVGMLIGMAVLYYFHIIPHLFFIVELFLNSYCIMTQRYTCIRINTILEKHKELEKRKENKANKTELLDYDLNLKNQSEKLEKQTQMPSSIEVCYWNKSFEPLEQMDSNFDDDFTKVLTK